MRLKKLLRMSGNVGYSGRDMEIGSRFPKRQAHYVPPTSQSEPTPEQRCANYILSQISQSCIYRAEDSGLGEEIWFYGHIHLVGTERRSAI